MTILHTSIPFDDASDALLTLIRCTDSQTGAIGIDASRAMTFRTRSKAAANQLAATYDGGTGYGIYRNPQWQVLERITDYIEGGQQSLCVSSGRAAIDLMLKLLPRDSHIIVAPGDVYTGTRALFGLYTEVAGLSVTYTDSTPEALEAAYIPGKTKMVFAETITNPMLKIADLRVISRFAREKGLIAVADNTAAPLLVQPLAHGFDVIASSLTKYIGGNNDLSAGVVVFHKNHSDLAQKLRVWRDKTGATLASSVAYDLIYRAVDFPQRLRVHCGNALAMATILERDPRIAQVRYPGLKSDPNHTLATTYYRHFGGLVSFDIKGGRNEAGRFLEALNHTQEVAVADSFGSDWFIGFPSEQSGFYKAMPSKDRVAYGITDSFFRLAAGRTNVSRAAQDIVRALDAAFDSLSAKPTRRPARQVQAQWAAAPA